MCLARMRRECFAQALEPRRAEAARVLAGEEGAEQHDGPRAVAQLAAELERAARENLAHELRVVVVAGNRIHRHAERLERGAEAFVPGAALVLHDVARGEDGIDGPAAIALRVLEHRKKRRVGGDAAHAAVRCRVQVRIADLQDGEGGVLAGHDARCGSTGEGNFDDTQNPIACAGIASQIAGRLGCATCMR